MGTYKRKQLLVGSHLLASCPSKPFGATFPLEGNDKHIEGTFLAYQNDKITHIMRFSCLTNLKR